MRKILLAALIAALLVAACGGDDESEPAAGGDGGGATALALEDNAFSPRTIEGEPGATITLALENTGKAEHTFTIEDQDIDEELEPGGTAQVDVEVPSSGSVEFICRYHEAGGMTGTLQPSGSGSAEDSDQGRGKGSEY
jgi:plastocyanin